MESMETNVVGKLVNREELESRNGKLFKHVVLVPAKDEYGYPNTVAILGSRPIGQINDLVEISATVRGRVNRNGNRTYHNHELWEKV